MERTSQRWDAGLYDGKHDFVWRHGASLVGLLAPKAGERVLDLGCGTGHLTAAIAAAGATVVGIDSSAEMLQQARSAYPALEFAQADATDFRFDQSFDAVFSNAVLHWVRTPETVIARVRDSLQVGGRFVAEFGGRGNIRTVVAAMGKAAERLGLPLEPANWYYPSVGEYATLLESAGLEVRFATLFDRPTPLEGDNGLRDWVRMFRRGVLEAMAHDRREDFLAAVEEAARPTLHRDGGWFADYRRLRIVAVRVA